MNAEEGRGGGTMKAGGERTGHDILCNIAKNLPEPIMVMLLECFGDAATGRPRDYMTITPCSLRLGPENIIRVPGKGQIKAPMSSKVARRRSS